MAQIPFFLATGWLGSGKTTFLKNLLNRHAAEHKILVVQNEFAPSGVDGIELRRTGKPFRILELNRGSVFCVCLFSDFCRALSAMTDEYRPDAVVLEATGLADPIAVAQLLETPALKERLFLKHIWCLVDASAYLKYARAVRQVTHQVRVADTVLLNKSDCATDADIELVKKEIMVLNPFARVETTSFAGTNLEDIFETQSFSTNAGRVAGTKPGPRPPVATAVLRHTGLTTRLALEAFADKYAAKVWRMKGFVRGREGSVSIQLIFGNLKIAEAADYEGPSEITALGEEFDVTTMRLDFERLFQPPAGAQK